MQALPWTSEEHRVCLEVAPTQAALHSLDVSLQDWAGGL